MRSRIVKRSDLAARLNVSPDEEIGKQLAERGEVTEDEAKLIDGGLFDDHLTRLRLRIDEAVEDVSAILRQLKTSGLIENIENQNEQDGYLFVELITRKFVPLAQELSKQIPDLALLLSIDNSVLFL
jgi:hypothetical protein